MTKVENLCFLCLAWFTTITRVTAEEKQIGGDFPRSFQRASMEDMVGWLRYYKFPVHFEEISVDPSKDHMTLDEKIKELESIDPVSLAEREKRILRNLRERKKTSPEKGASYIDWRKKRFDLSLHAQVKNVDEVLDLLMQKDPDYVWERSNTSFIIRPRNPVDRGRVKSFVLQNSDFKSAAAKFIAEVLNPSKLGWVVVDLGSTPPLEERFRSVKLNLHLGDVDIYTALTRFCECLGPHVVWTIKGMTGTDAWSEVGINVYASDEPAPKDAAQQ